MSYIGMGANLVGGIMQSIAASKEQAAMYQAFQDELARQGRYRANAFGTLEGALPKMGAEEAQSEMDKGTGERRQMYGDVMDRSLGVGSTPFSAADHGRLNLLGNARANVGAYSDWQLNQAINQIKLREQLNKISNFAQGTAQVFPYRMYNAQHSMDELDFWGKTISSIGSGGAGMTASAPQMPQQPQMYGTGFSDPYGQYWPAGWQNMGGAAEGTSIPG